MHAKPYPEAKRRLLLERSVEDFVAFLKEVTDSEGEVFIRNQLLPSNVAGFRPGRAPISRTVPMLISNLRNEQEVTNPNSRIWDMFKNAWVYWVSSHQKLNNTLTEFDNSADFDENQGSIVPPNSELDRQCFRDLLEASLNNRIAQETIRRFYEYGHFNQCDQIENLINEAHSREEIQRRQQIEQLPNQVNRLQQEINDLRTQFSNLDTVSELQHVLEQRIAEVQRSFEEQISQLNLSQSVNQLTQSIETLKSRLDELKNSQNETDSGINDFVEHIEEIIRQLEQKIQDTDQSVSDKLEQTNSTIRDITQQSEQMQNNNQAISERLDSMDNAIAEIKSMVEKQNQPNVPRIAKQAVEIGRRYGSELTTDGVRYSDEDEYMENLNIFQRRFGLTNLEKRKVSQEIAAAVHIAMKAFPALEITDERPIKIWKLICGEHLHITKINVELGWLGKQDWFPDLFSEECFDKRLEKIDLDISIREMLEVGDIPWAIHLNNCDKSYPDSYLPSFLDWIKKICGDSIRVFLTRCSGTNRCITNEDFYERVARLPKPNKQEPINVRYLEDQYVVTRSEWVSWCCPDTDVNLPNEDQLIFVDQLRLIFEENDMPIPITLLREIQHYLRLSHNILASTCALDWALTLRLLPWIGNRRKLINQVLSMPDFEDSDFPHFSKGLQQAREKGK